MSDPCQTVYTTLKNVGIPGTMFAWSLGNAPALPWFVYYQARGGETFADNSNYHQLPRFRAELYLKEDDPELTARFEEAVESLGPFVRRDSWLESEGCMMHSYSFTLTREVD